VGETVGLLIFPPKSKWGGIIEVVVVVDVDDGVGGGAIIVVIVEFSLIAMIDSIFALSLDVNHALGEKCILDEIVPRNEGIVRVFQIRDGECPVE